MLEIVILLENEIITNETLNRVDWMVDQNLSIFLSIYYSINSDQITNTICS